MFREYFKSVSKHLEREHKAMNKREEKNIQMLQNRGEITDERKTENENAQKAYDKLLTNTNTLAVRFTRTNAYIYTVCVGCCHPFVLLAVLLISGHPE